MCSRHNVCAALDMSGLDKQRAVGDTASLPPAGPFWRRDHPPRAASITVEALTRPPRSLASFGMAAQAVVWTHSGAAFRGPRNCKLTHGTHQAGQSQTVVLPIPECRSEWHLPSSSSQCPEWSPDPSAWPRVPWDLPLLPSVMISSSPWLPL